jgi:hypothetical protein
MNGPNGKPTKPDNDFEPLAPALEKRFGKKFARLPAKLRKRITRDRRAAMLALLWDGTTPGRQRSMAQQWVWESDPANKDEGDFWWDVGARYCEVKLREDELKIVPAIGAQAVAARNHEQRLIEGERTALKEDVREVRSVDPTELRATIERVRRRWDERALRSAGMRDGPLRAPAGVDPPEALVACFVLPVETWPRDVRPPTEDQCRKAASDVLAEEIIPENVAEKPRADTDKDKTSKGGAPEHQAPEATEKTPEETMTGWLAKLMRDQPTHPISKADAHALAVEDGLQRISDRGFEDRAWPDAVKASGVQKKKWSGAGRREKAALIAARNRRTKF